MRANLSRVPLSEAEGMMAVHYFAFGPTGYAGAPSVGENTLRRIIAQPSAEADLEAIFNGGTPEAMCYALVGLKKVSLSSYRSHMKTFEELPPAIVHVMSGCVVQEMEGKTVLQRIGSGVYDGFADNKAKPR